MASSGYHSARSTNWLAILAGTAFCAGAVFVMARHLDQAVGEAIVDNEPELAMPLSPVETTPVQTEALSREEENWQEMKLGSISLQLPGTPREDPKPGWFDRYTKVTRPHAYSIPVEHRQSHIRVSSINYSTGNISITAAALAAKHGIEAEFSGVTTIYPFEFRNLSARHISARPVDVDDLTRLHAYLIIHKNEMLILSITGHDKHPNRLAHQILRTIEVH